MQEALPTPSRRKYNKSRTIIWYKPYKFTIDKTTLSFVKFVLDRRLLNINVRAIACIQHALPLRIWSNPDSSRHASQKQTTSFEFAGGDRRWSDPDTGLKDTGLEDGHIFSFWTTPWQLTLAFWGRKSGVSYATRVNYKIYTISHPYFIMHLLKKHNMQHKRAVQKVSQARTP